MRRTEGIKIIFNMKIIQRILSGKFLDINIRSSKYQLIHIRITNLAGKSFFSLWEEVNKGDNPLAVDISGLIKGPYKIVVDFPEESPKEELFTIY